MKTQTIFSVLVALVALFSTGATSADAPPNIVLILSDDQSWTDYGFMGHEAIQTPNLDKLARESAVFRRGYVPTALCRPALATLITGLYSHQNGITGNGPAATAANRAHAKRTGIDAREMLISNIDKHPTLPRMLAKQRYLSFQSGKWWEGSYQRGGFTHGMTRGFPKPGGRHGDDGLKIGREGMQPVNDFIDTATEAGKPFFLWYAPFLPHTPHNPPKRLLDKYRDGRPITNAKYYAMCEWFDETCGQLMASLKQRGLDDNTMIVYLTDNGWIQDPEKNGYAPRSKQTPYEGGVRTPIMYWMPGKIRAGIRPELVSSIDIYPTVLAAAGAELPTDRPGLNLLPNLTSGDAIARDTVFGEGFAHDIADIEDPEATLLYRWCVQGKWKLLLTYDGEVNRYQLTHPRTEKGPQLFDLIADPAETKNLATANPAVVARLAEEINNWYPVKKAKTITTP